MNAYQLSILFIETKRDNPTDTDAQLWTKVRTLTRKAGRRVQLMTDPREYTHTDAERAAEDAPDAQAQADLLSTLQAELAAETAPEGFNRADVIAEIQAKITELGG